MNTSFLVVEDEVDLREFLVLMLSRAGDAVGAGTGEEALQVARSRPVDVALCDFVLPGVIRGFDLVRQLHNLAEPPVVILVTGYADEALAAEATAQGVFAVFGKPFDLDALLAKVKEALGARRARGAPNPS